MEIELLFPGSMTHLVWKLNWERKIGESSHHTLNDMGENLWMKLNIYISVMIFSDNCSIFYRWFYISRYYVLTHDTTGCQTFEIYAVFCMITQ